MRRRSLLTLALTAGSAVGASLVSGRARAVPAVGDDASLMGPFRLELLHRQRIDAPGLGLDEPSGLTLNADGTALYTVSDDTRTIFCMDLKGEVLADASFPLNANDLEGIALSADGKRLLAVHEETNAVISIDLASRRELRRQPLAGMDNYAGIARHFAASPDNKGLEGKFLAMPALLSIPARG